MKRLVLCIGLFLFVVSMASASLLMDSISFASDISRTVSRSKGQKTTIKQLQLNLAELDVPALSAEERVAIYTSNELKTGGAFARNLLLGFGSGSARQGDTTGALIGAIGDGIGVAALSVSLTCFLVDLLTVQTIHSLGTGSAGSLNMDSPLMKATIYTAIGGGAIIVATRIFESIRVFTYASKYNRTLREGLGLDKNLQLAAAPLINPVSGQPGVMFVARVSL